MQGAPRRLRPSDAQVYRLRARGETRYLVDGLLLRHLAFGLEDVAGVTLTIAGLLDATLQPEDRPIIALTRDP